MTYRIELSRQARRALTQELPEAVAAACYEFIRGPLASDPFRVGKPLEAPLAPKYVARRGEYRIIYAILEQVLLVQVITIRHRRDAYHT